MPAAEAAALPSPAKPSGAAAPMALSPPATPAGGPRTAASPAASLVTPPTSDRRSAAEAALHRRFSPAQTAQLGGSTGGSGSGSATSTPTPTPTHTHSAAPEDVVTVPPCGTPSSWCGLGPVVIPRWAWQALAGGRVAVVPPAPAPGRPPAPGAARSLTAAVVEDPAHLPAALAHLRSTMRDRLVAIDLEWSPDGGWRGGLPAPPSPVALVQLASATHALLIRVCCFPGWKKHGGASSAAASASSTSSTLPAPLADFLADPAVTVVGFAWGCGDEAKAVATWGRGLAGGLFGSGEAGAPGAAAAPAFVDAQAVAKAMHYAGVGLGPLAARVLGVALPKSQAVAMSDWGAAARPLSADQVLYAALDALAAGHVLRGLRLLHHGARIGDLDCDLAPACPGCAVPVGAVVVGGGCDALVARMSAACRAYHHCVRPPTCAACGRVFRDGVALANHARATRHGDVGGGGGGACGGCGRWA